MVSELERMAEAAKAARIKLLNDMSVVEPRTPGEPWPWTKYAVPSRYRDHRDYMDALDRKTKRAQLLTIFVSEAGLILWCNILLLLLL